MSSTAASYGSILVMQLTYKVRAYPTRAQHALFADYLEHTRQIYNAALEERINCYRLTGRTLSKYEQSRELTELRAEPDYARFPRRLQRWALNLLDAAYQGMFTRNKKGEKLGPPRFRGRLFWSTIGWDSPIDFTMRDRGLHSKKSFGGTLRLHPDRPLPPYDDCTALHLCRDGDRWFAHLTYKMADAPVKERPERPVGIDLGLKTLAMRSDGTPMSPPRQDQSDTQEMRRASRALSRCKKRSRRRARVRTRLRKVHARIANKRKAALHVISARLTHHFDAVAIEDLNIRGLNQGGGIGAKGRGVRKSWRDRAPGLLSNMLTWKCQRDGRPFAAVNPQFTTILCAQCGAAVPKTLLQRVHICQCGDVRDRDWNAALNILARAGWGPGDVKSGVRAAVSAAPGADLSLKHGGLTAAGPRRDGDLARPPPSISRGRQRSA